MNESTCVDVIDSGSLEELSDAELASQAVLLRAQEAVLRQRLRALLVRRAALMGRLCPSRGCRRPRDG